MMAENADQDYGADYYRVMTLHGASVYLSWHALLLIVLLAVSALLRQSSSLALIASMALIPIAHEAGHVFAAAALRLKVHSVYIGLFEGACVSGLPAKAWQTAVLWAGGVLAQITILALAVLYLALYGVSASNAEALLMLIAGNVLIIVYNLVPRASSHEIVSDGRMLWLLYLHCYKGQPYPHPLPIVLPADQSPLLDAGANLLAMPALVPHGFVTGIEILNDRTTPMEFVISTLMRHLDVDKDKAVQMMADIHNRGGKLIQLPDMSRAEQVASAITADAQQAGHPFVCRAVDANAARNGVRND